MNKGEIAIVVAVISFIGGILGIYLYQTDFFVSSDIRIIRTVDSDDGCPLYFNMNDGSFKLSFRNSDGNRGTDLFVTLQASNNISFIKKYDAIHMPMDSSSTLNFEINTSSIKNNNYDVINNITIFVVGNYSVYVWGKINHINTECNYEKNYNSFFLAN